MKGQLVFFMIIFLSACSIEKEEWVCQINPADPPWYNKESELLPSGLLGPVSLNASKTE